MRCNKAREFLSLEMDGVMPPKEAVKLEKHLEVCTDCQVYQTDLHMGRRLLAATEPELSENFDWKLHLRLNQTLKEAAGEAAFPWGEQPTDRWAWVRNFGAAAAVGMAAVLAVAVFLGPTGPNPGSTPASSGERAVAAQTSSSNDRLPLDRSASWNGLRTGALQQRPVSVMSTMPVNSRLRLDSGWSGGNPEDLLTITRLKTENRHLKSALVQYQWQLRQMQAQLDTTGRKALDLQE